MARQGSQSQRITLTRVDLAASRFRCAASALVLLVPVACSSLSLTAHADESAATVDLRVQLNWSATENRFWRTQLSVVDRPEQLGARRVQPAAITELQNHCESSLTTGAFGVSPDGNILTFQPRHRMTGGGAQFRLRVSGTAKLQLEIESDSSVLFDSKLPKTVREISVSQLVAMSGVSSTDTDETGTNSGSPTQWTLKRVPDDQLRLQDLETSLVYAPGSQIEFSAVANLLGGHADQQLSLSTAIYRVADGQTVATTRSTIAIDSHGNSSVTSIELTAPDAPGVYEIRTALLAPSNEVWRRLRGRESLVTRVRHPIIIASNNSEVASRSRISWTFVGTIFPSDSSRSVNQWLPKNSSRFLPGSLRVDTWTSESRSPAAQEEPTITLIPPLAKLSFPLPRLEPGVPHRLTLRLPKSEFSELLIEIASSDDSLPPALSRSLDTTTAEVDPESPWKTHSLIYYPAGSDNIRISNRSESQPAPIESISVEAGSRQASVEAGDVVKARTALLRLEGIDWVSNLTPDLAVQDGRPLSSCDDWTINVHRLWSAINRIQDYADEHQFSGVMLPANGAGRAWFESLTFSANRVLDAHEANHLATLMTLLDRTGIDVYLSVHPEMLLSTVEDAIKTNPTLIKSITLARSGNNRQYNLVHPLVQEQVTQLMMDVRKQVAQYRCFQGIAIDCGDGSHFEPASDFLVDPIALERFAASQGKTLDPLLRSWVQREGKEQFENWVDREVTRAYSALAAGAESGDQTVFLLDPSTVTAKQLDSAKAAAALTFRFGPGGEVAANADVSESASVFNEADAPPPSMGLRVVQIGVADQRDVNEPIRVSDRILTETNRIVDRLDPGMIIVRWPVLARTSSDQLAALVQSFTAVPAGVLRELTPFDPASQTVKFRSGVVDGHLVVSLLSLAPWTSEVDIECTDAVRWAALGAGTDDRIVSMPSDRSRARVRLAPDQRLLIKSEAPSRGVRVRSWSAGVRGGSETVQQIKQRVTSVVQRIGILSEMDASDALRNGSFEQSGGVGLVGWLHAQHPPDCVRIDNTESSDGKQSVLLTNDNTRNNRTWLVSETFDPPISGRLAVSLACRGEQRSDESHHRIRISIEATSKAGPVRFSNEFEVPQTGSWGAREIVLEAEGIDPKHVDSLRLTIDSFSSGRVWIDDVRLHDQFATAKERAGLQSQAFLAIHGLQRGNLTPCAELLENQWAQHLLTKNLSAESIPAIEKFVPEIEAPGVAERIFRWLPRPIRF